MKLSLRAAGSAVSPSERVMTFRSADAAEAWLARVAHEHRRLLRDALADAGTVSLALLDDREVVRRVAQLLAHGRINAVEHVPLTIVSNLVEEEPIVAPEVYDYMSPRDETPAWKMTSWIGIVVMRDDEFPLAGQKYRLELPTGMFREGATDADGKIQFSAIAPGQCRLTLVDLKVERELATGSEHTVVIEEDWDFDLNVVPTPEHPEPEEPVEDGRWTLDNLARDIEAA